MAHQWPCGFLKYRPIFRAVHEPKGAVHGFEPIYPLLKEGNIYGSLVLEEKKSGQVWIGSHLSTMILGLIGRLSEVWH